MKQRDRKPKPQQEKAQRRQQHQPPPRRLWFPEPEAPAWKPMG